jgi:hypothetical protein
MRRTLPPRRSDRALLWLGLLATCLAATWIDGARLRRHRSGSVERNRLLASALRLSDLCLFGEAPTTRHLTQADAFSSMQDHPGAFDHSRSGSLVGPPAALSSTDATVAEPPAIPR